MFFITNLWYWQNEESESSVVLAWNSFSISCLWVINSLLLIIIISAAILLNLFCLIYIVCIVSWRIDVMSFYCYLVAFDFCNVDLSLLWRFCLLLLLLAAVKYDSSFFLPRFKGCCWSYFLLVKKIKCYVYQQFILTVKCKDIESKVQG